MEGFLDPDLCRCCETPAARTPAIIFNRPGLSAIAYRVGTFATFRQTMLEAIGDEPALAQLTTRESDDYAITLLELWAAVADVLTFYQERIANEAFLRTAVHRDSVLRLARLLDYQLRSGLAARARVAFTLDDNATVKIPVGLKLMSVPSQDERPQFFETVENIVAEARYNRVRVLPVPTVINPFSQNRRSAPLITKPAPLGPGDKLVFFSAFRIEEKTVAELAGKDTGVYLTWTPAVQDARFDPRAAHAAKSEKQLRFFGYNAPASIPQYNPGQIDTTTGRWNPPPHWENIGVPGHFDDTVTEYPLDTRYEDLKPGSQLLVDTATAPDPMRLVTITETGQKSASLGPITDTVTHVKVTRSLGSAPLVLSRATNRVDVFARSATESGLHLEWTGAAWRGWDPLGGVLASQLAADSWGSNRLDVFVQGTNNGLYHRWRQDPGAWQPAAHQWEWLGGILTSRPAVVARMTNRLDVFVRGPDWALWHKWWNGTTWSGWQSLGGIITSAPVVASWGANRLDVFVRGLDGQLWHRGWDGTGWSDWKRRGGVITADMAAIARAPNRLDLFARAKDNALWHTWWDGADWHSASRSGTIAGTPAVASWGVNRLDVFVRGQDNGLWHLPWDGVNWSPWVSLGGLLSSDPAAVSWGANRIDVFARGVDTGLTHRAWNGAWQPWDGLGLGVGEIADRRNTRIYELEPPELEFRRYDYADTISGARVAVPFDKLQGIDINRNVLFQASNTEPVAAKVTAAMPFSATFSEEPDHLAIDFTPELPTPLDTESSVLLGNVARATHGGTVADEILGDGDGSQTFQRFVLRKSPLTHLATSKSPQGEVQLTVLVNGEQWTRVASLYGQGPNARVYTAQQADDGTTTLQFGDGVTGARLPSGRSNVKATYRQGVGLEGRLRADQLSILLTRPPGLKAATNPPPTEGGADPESLDQARTNAPTTVKTFGRAVSVADFESLVTISGEVAKAKATWVWRDLEKAVHLTVAAQQGGSFSVEGLKLIHDGLTAARDPNHALLIDNVCRVAVSIIAKLTVDANHLRDEVLASARDALSEFLSFDRMPLGRPVYRSDIYAVLQGVEGVVSVDLDHFHFKGALGWTAAELAARGATAAPVQVHLRIFEARPAAQATIDPAISVCIASGPMPQVLPAEQAYAETADLVLTATGGLA